MAFSLYSLFVNSISSFVSKLQRSAIPSVFNPWQDIDPVNDAGAASPRIRTKQLEHFLKMRLKSARFCLLGEALSYQGGHFSGIAMMSERILLGHSLEKGISPQAVLPKMKPERTSKAEIIPLGFAEPTASMVWGLIMASGHPPEQFLTWNSFAWHPYDLKKGMLSNRRPSMKEAEAGLDILKNFLALFPRVKLIAVGQFPGICLGRLGVRAESVRHPAYGGAPEFRAQMKKILNSDLPLISMQS